MSGLAHRYANSSCDKNGFSLDREHLAALRDLRRNENIVISKPDKCNGVVILDKDDYVEKMADILSQTDKFECLGDVETNDKTILRYCVRGPCRPFFCGIGRLVLSRRRCMTGSGRWDAADLVCMAYPKRTSRWYRSGRYFL